MFYRNSLCRPKTRFLAIGALTSFLCLPALATLPAAPLLNAQSTSPNGPHPSFEKDLDALHKQAINPDLVITFSEFPFSTPITSQYSNLGILFGGDSPFITGDTANPTSPVLSGTPTFEGTIEGFFVDPNDGTTPTIVGGFSLDAGFFDALGSVRLQWFDLNGQLLGQRAGSQFGIETFRVEGGSIHRFKVEIIKTEPAGFAIDNVSFLPESTASLLFREREPDKKDGTWGFGKNEIPGFDHIGFHIDNRVYESHPGNPAGTYVSANGDESVVIAEVNGVQAQHSRKTFEHDARQGEATPVIDFDEIIVAPELAQAMKESIDENALGARFQRINFSFPDGINRTLAPAAQKGGGGTYTCVGLVEWAAEKAGHKDSQGFVPNWLESFTFPSLEFPPKLFQAPLLSPQLLNYMAKLDAAVDNAAQWFQGFLDPVDFLITDPLGRRLGYTEELGELREIPNAFFSGDGNLEQFLIPNPLPGDYQIDLFGKGANVAGAVNVGGQVEVIDQPLAVGETLAFGLNLGAAPGSRGDLDGDGDIDNDDLSFLLPRLGAFANGLNDPGDLDADGLLAQADADLLVQLCDRPGCAVGIGTTCAANSQTLCRQQERFKIAIEWRDFEGKTGNGGAIPFGSDDSGLFWFFSPNNWEILVKVLDGCAANDHFWVFSAATTNVEYTLQVTDTLTGSTSTYFNPLGNAAAAITDTTAFRTCTTQRGEALPARFTTLEAAKPSPPPAKTSSNQTVNKGTCTPTATDLCLSNRRFQVEVEWRDRRGNTGQAKVVPVGSVDSGLFWFFNPNNWEMLIKVLDGCAINDRFWVFSAATTNVEYTLRVTDTETGTTASYFNPLGNAAAAITDTDALPVCR